MSHETPADPQSLTGAAALAHLAEHRAHHSRDGAFVQPPTPPAAAPVSADNPGTPPSATDPLDRYTVLAAHEEEDFWADDPPGDELHAPAEMDEEHHDDDWRDLDLRRRRRVPRSLAAGVVIGTLTLAIATWSLMTTPRANTGLTTERPVTAEETAAPLDSAPPLPQIQSEPPPVTARPTKTLGSRPAPSATASARASAKRPTTSKSPTLSATVRNEVQPSSPRPKKNGADRSLVGPTTAPPPPTSSVHHDQIDLGPTVVPPPPNQ